jgi:hypothetical protein
MFIEKATNGKPTLVGASTGAVIGLVAITPGAGFVPVWSAVIIGLLVSPISFFFISVIKKKFRYDDALDVFGCHGIGGIWGGIATGLFAQSSINPAAQWTARAAVDDIERRADQVALRLTGSPAGLAAAIRALMLGESHPPPAVSERFERMFWGSRVLSVERRCRRVLGGAELKPLDAGGLRLALAAVGIVGLLFFVV